MPLWFWVVLSACVQAVPFRALPAAASFELAIMNGLPGNLTAAAACRGGVLSRSRWYWRAEVGRFRLDCLHPQPDPQQQCPWMYAAAQNIWHYNVSSYHVFSATPPPSCDVAQGVEDHSGDHSFGAQYPFEFPPSSTFVRREPCPDGSHDICELWQTPELSQLPHHVLWWLRPEGDIVRPVRAILVLQYDGPIAVCLEFSHFDGHAPDMSVFDPPSYCNSSSHSVSNRATRIASASPMQRIKALMMPTMEDAV